MYGEKNTRRKLMAKKNIRRYRLTGSSTRSGKIDEKKKNVDGINIAAQKTNFSLKAAKLGSLVWSRKKIKNIHKDIASVNIQNLLLIVFAGFLKSTKTPSPAINRNIKMNITWLANIIYIPKDISSIPERHVSHPHYDYLLALCPGRNAWHDEERNQGHIKGQVCPD